MCVFCYFISRTFVSKDNCVCGLNENGWKRLIGQRLQNIPGNDQLGFPESFLFCMMERVPGGMFWAKVAHFGPPGTPQKSAFFYKRGRKRVKEWRQVTFRKRHLKALEIPVILRCVGAWSLVSFRSYGRLNKKCRYKKLCNSKTLLLLKLYFGQHFTERAQCIITHVIYMDICPYQYRAKQKRMSSSNNICALLGFLCTAKQRGNLLTQCTHCPHVPS